MSLTNLCRLCANSICDNGKSLYSENGQHNELFNTIFDHFHPKILDLSRPMHFTSLCSQCCEYIEEFQNFQNMVQDAQLKLQQLDEEFKDLDIQMENAFAVLPGNPPTDYSLNEDYLELYASDEEHFLVKGEKQPQEFLSNIEPKVETIFEITEVEDNKNIAIVSKSESAETQLAVKIYACPDFGDPNYLEPNSEYDLMGKNYRRNLQGPTLDDLIRLWLPTIKCLECSSSLSSYNNYRRHFRRIHSGTQFYLNCCGYKFGIANEIKEHMLYHINPESFKCEICIRCFTTNVSLQRHMPTWHPETQKPKFPCDKCEKSFITRKGFSYHRTKNHEILKKAKPVVLTDGSSVYSCEDCDYQTSIYRSYQSHRWFMHSPRNSFNCNVCGKVFKKASWLANHLVIHHGGKFPYSCKICKAGFRSKTGFRRHMKENIHDVKKVKKSGYLLGSSKRYRCSRCPSKFREEKNLINHQRCNHVGDTKVLSKETDENLLPPKNALNKDDTEPCFDGDAQVLSPSTSNGALYVADAEPCFHEDSQILCKESESPATVEKSEKPSTSREVLNKVVLCKESERPATVEKAEKPATPREALNKVVSVPCYDEDAQVLCKESESPATVEKAKKPSTSREVLNKVNVEPCYEEDVHVLCKESESPATVEKAEIPSTSREDLNKVNVEPCYEENAQVLREEPEGPATAIKNQDIQKTSEKREKSSSYREALGKVIEEPDFEYTRKSKVLREEPEGPATAIKNPDIQKSSEKLENPSTSREALRKVIEEPDFESTRKSKEKNVKSGTCKTCAEGFRYTEDLKKHLLDEHEGKGLYKCPNCTISFTYPNALLHHRKVAHPDEFKRAKNLKKKDRFKCPDCSMTFTNRHTFERHCILIHSFEMKDTPLKLDTIVVD